MSPVLSNLFLHYVFDAWMQRNHQEILWCRYADDGVLHCRTLQQAELTLQRLEQKFKECGLELHREKTKIFYCKDGNRKKKFLVNSFTFLGYEFRARACKNTKKNSIFTSFTPAVSKAAIKSMRSKTRDHGVRNRADLNIANIARWFDPILSGWLNYYGRYSRSAMYPVWRHFNMTLVTWAMNKYRHLRGRKMKAVAFLERISREQSKLFSHWRAGMRGAFA
jgi:hypothetical protein